MQGYEDLLRTDKQFPLDEARVHLGTFDLPGVPILSPPRIHRHSALTLDPLLWPMLHGYKVQGTLVEVGLFLIHNHAGYLWRTGELTH